MSPEECVAIGGHCWVQDDVVMTNGYSSSYRRRCKHCRTEQTGVSRPSIVWTDK